MIRYLTEEDVKELLTMPMALELVEEALRARALGRATDIPRVRTRTPQGTLHVLQASSQDLNRIGFKAYYSSASGTRFHVHLYDLTKGPHEAMVEANYLGIVRTGAASGVATRYLAREDATIVAAVGAGRQAAGQLAAVCAVCKVREVRVWSRKRENSLKFIDTLAQRLNVEMRPVETVAEAVNGAHIINVMTKAVDPVLRGEWLERGQHINAAGSNALTRREIDLAAVERCDYITVDSRGTARNECGDLLPAVEKGIVDWDTVTEIGEVIVGHAPRRTSPDEITLYESHGMGIQDLYVAHRLVALARERGIGVDLPVGRD
ncbi:MAG TPA: ornithine cyclodeaminase family protein [Burkholderiales bacterium]|nr:ornithine cyclodeaminase family protein [Burkholderiales bacterium]